MKKYYIILDQETGKAVSGNGHNTFLFDSESDAVLWILGEGRIERYYDESYKIIEIIL